MNAHYVTEALWDDDGAARKEQGMARAIAGAIPWPDMADDWIRGLDTGDSFTSEDVIAAIGLPRGTVGKDTNNAVGASISAAARAGLIRRVGYIKARRPNSHHAIIGVWRRS